MQAKAVFDSGSGGRSCRHKDTQGALANLTGEVARVPVATQVVRDYEIPLALTNCRFACPCWGRAAKHQLNYKLFSLAASRTASPSGTGGTQSALRTEKWPTQIRL